MARMPSVMQHTFSQVPKAEIQRSSFDRSFSHKTTFDSSFLIPVFVDEALPGDTFSINATFFARLSTPLHPLMDNLRLNSFFFAVPYRIIWDNFQRFMGEQPNPGDSTDFQVPHMQPPTGGYAARMIYDYLGLPVAVDGFTHSSLPLRAYNLIWNEWFRDQNLQNSIAVPKGDTSDPPTTYTLMRRGKRHDYFTSSLPWPQKGPGVDIPLGSWAPIKSAVAPGSEPSIYDSAIGTASAFLMNASAATVTRGANAPTTSGGMYADLTEATAATINQLRQAFQLQKLYERDARGGTRYTEIVRAHFNVVSPDARLQRPEYLGGGSSPVNFYSVPQTSATGQTGAETPQANLAAYSTVSGGGHGFTKSFTEHCVVLGLVCVTADLTYQSGLNRMWSRKTKFDFYWPALSHIGEQAVLNKEIFTAGTPADEDVWGYQERYAEYRFYPSMITGAMRSNFPQSLDTWHLSQHFVALPPLNDAFISEAVPIPRVVAVNSEPQFIFDSFFKFRAARPMPVYGVPGNIDRF